MSSAARGAPTVITASVFAARSARPSDRLTPLVELAFARMLMCVVDPASASTSRAAGDREAAAVVDVDDVRSELPNERPPRSFVVRKVETVTTVEVFRRRPLELLRYALRSFRAVPGL